MMHWSGSPALALGTTMLVLALVIPCQPTLARAARLAALHGAMLAAVILARALAGDGVPFLPLAGLVLLGKVFALPRLLAGIPDRRPAGGFAGSPLGIFAAGTSLAILAWIALPPLANRLPAITQALAMLAVGLLPTILGHAAPRRLLGLLVAQNGVLLAALALPDPWHPLLLELAATVLLGALLVTARQEPASSRSSP